MLLCHEYSAILAPVFAGFFAGFEERHIVFGGGVTRDLATGGDDASPFRLFDAVDGFLHDELWRAVLNNGNGIHIAKEHLFRSKQIDEG